MPQAAARAVSANRKFVPFDVTLPPIVMQNDGERGRGIFSSGRLRILPLDLFTMTFSALALATPLPDFEDLSPHPSAPDPLVALDGTRVTTAEGWRQRAAELRELFQHFEYGRLPSAPARVEAKIERTEEAFGGKGTLREVTLTWGMPGAAIHLLVITPKSEKPVPTFLGLSFVDPREALPGGRQEKVWNVARALERGYAMALFWNGDLMPDKADEARERLQQFWPAERAEAAAGDGCGTIAAWAWGVMRAMDYLVTAPDIDAKRIATVGHSRNGKTVLLAAAMDERIALVIPSQAGCCGTAPSRVAPELSKIGPDGKPAIETVAFINDTFPHWFCRNFKKFNTEPARLPVDQHELIALCVPRPVLVSAAASDGWANPDGQFEMLRAADPVYRLIAGEGMASAEKPPASAPTEGRLAYFLRPGKHEMNEADWAAWLNYADLWLKGS